MYCNHWMLKDSLISKLHCRYWRKLRMVTSCWNNCCFLCLIHKLFCSHRNNNCIVLSLGINLRIKWNSLYFKNNMLIIHNIDWLRKCWYRWNLFLGCSNWNCNNRNLQTLIMLRCHYKFDNTHRMRCICCFNCLYNLRNSLYSISHMFIILSSSWLRLRNRWSLLLGNNNNSCNKYYCRNNFISLQT